MAQVGKTHFQATPGSGNENAFPLSQYAAQPGSFAAPGCIDGPATGNVWFVSSTNANALDDVQHGYSPESPLKTIAYAVATAAKADNDDLVLVLPGHVENLTTTASINMSVAGVTLRGKGCSRQRGTINYITSTNASFDITAARCVVENLTFVGTGFAAVTAMVNVKAADATIRNCEFEHANATNQATDVIVTNTTANRLWVWNNDFHGTANAGTSHCILINGGSDIEIALNNMQGLYHTTEGLIRIVTTATTNLVLDSNTMQNSRTSNTKAIVDSVTGSTGQIRSNTMQILSGAAPITGATMSWAGGNYFAQTIATLGVLI